jgi:hypothetical protein
VVTVSIESTSNTISALEYITYDVGNNDKTVKNIVFKTGTPFSVG